MTQRKSNVILLLWATKSQKPLVAMQKQLPGATNKIDRHRHLVTMETKLIMKLMNPW